MTEIAAYIISEVKDGFKVQDAYNMGVVAVVPIEEVHSVETKIEDTEIAAILGVIELARKSCTTRKRPARRIAEEAKASTVSMLLWRYSPEEVIRILEEMKYHEIRDLCTSEEPWNVIDMI